MKSLLIPVFLLSLGAAQSGPPSEIPFTSKQDPTARQLIEQTIQASAVSQAAANFKSYVLTGDVQIEGQSDAQVLKVSCRSMHDLRLETTYPDGRVDVVIKGGAKGGAHRNRDGQITTIRTNARAGTEIPFLPLPGILSDLLASAGAIEDLGADTVDGRPVHHVTISRGLPQGADPNGVLTARSKVDLFIDVDSFLILRMSHIAADVSGRWSHNRVATFAAYRAVNGAMVPFLLTEMLDEQKTWSLKVNSIDFNHKLQDSDFQF